MELDLPQARQRLMLALDTDSREKAEEWVHRMRPQVGVFKVGLQLFTKEGPELVRSIRARGGHVFLDVKYHDIPNTVARACEAACSLGVDFVNVHALGGKAMIKAAALALKDSAARMRLPKPKLLAVTILTSHDATSLKKEVGLRKTPEAEVKRLALLAQSAGADGVVCSPREIAVVRKACGKDFIIVTPGIRAAGGAKQDQRRTLTAAQAIARGADYLVIGRPITGAADPSDAATKLVQEIAQALAKLVKAPAKRKKR